MMKKKYNISDIKNTIRKLSDLLGLKNLRGEYLPKHGVLLVWGWNVPRFHVSPKGETLRVAYSARELLDAAETAGLEKILGRFDIDRFGPEHGWFDINYPELTTVGCKPAIVLNMEKLEKFLQWHELNREFGPSK